MSNSLDHDIEVLSEMVKRLKVYRSMSASDVQKVSGLIVEGAQLISDEIIASKGGDKQETFYKPLNHVDDYQSLAGEFVTLWGKSTKILEIYPSATTNNLYIATLDNKLPESTPFQKSIGQRFVSKFNGKPAFHMIYLGWDEVHKLLDFGALK